MGSFPVVLLLCGFQVLIVAVWAQQAEQGIFFVDNGQNDATSERPQECREETYPCTRMYSVHKPTKKCISSLCLYSTPRVYVINHEVCVRTVCQQDELLQADLCRERSGWPKRRQRSTKTQCRHKNSQDLGK